VELRGVLLGLLEAAALVRQGVDDDRRAVLGNVLGARERFLELLEVVVVDGPDVVEAEFVPDQVREEEAFDRGLELPRELPGLVAVREALEEAVAGVDEFLVRRMELETIAPVGEPADVLGDRPPVVVQDHDEALRLGVHDVVEGFVRRARGQRAVADDDDDVGVFRGALESHRDAETVGKPGARVAGGQGVMAALGGFGEPGKPAWGANGGELVPAPGHQLMGVALVGRVPDEPVFGAVEEAVHRDRQFHHAEVRRQVAAGLRDRLDDDLPAVLRQLL